MNHKAAEILEQQDAGLTNLTISIIQRQERFEYIPEFNRHLAMNSQQALNLILKPFPTKVARNTLQTRKSVRIASNV